MNPDAQSGLQHQVDRLVISGRRVFGWGWAAHRTAGVRSVHLRLSGDGWERRLPAGTGLSRYDVKEAFPGLTNAEASGFVLTGYIPKEGVRRLFLDVELEGGTTLSVDASGAAQTLDERRNKRRLVTWVARSIWRRLRRGDFIGILSRAKAQHYAAPSLDEVGVFDELLRALAGARDACIMFDHNMGGGANQYRRAAIAERLARSHPVLLCTYNLPMLEYRLHLFRPGEEERVFKTSGFVLLEEIIEKVDVSEIFVNSPVSFDEPLLLADWLARMRKEHPRVRMTVAVHDYFSICPSFVLLNANGRYCGIPEISECAACLKRHEASYVALSPPTEIGPWRALWGRCLEAADEVRCFSGSSLDHLMRAYPTLDRARISVVPHRDDYTPERLPEVDHRAPLVIGIAGEISHQKGALVVKDLIDQVERGHPGIRVVVLGTLHLAHHSERLHVTGPYQRSDLVDLIERHGINMFLFPSIWPETFSYVVGELMTLGMPVVAFDLGAPAERLRGYRNARLVREVTGAAALRALIDLHAQLAAEARSAA